MRGRPMRSGISLHGARAIHAGTAEVVAGGSRRAMTMRERWKNDSAIGRMMESAGPASSPVGRRCAPCVRRG